MGYALANAAIRRGAKVILVSGPVALEAPSGAQVVQVETAQQMREAVISHSADVSVLIASAAVADFRVHHLSQQKIKRNGPMTLDLEPTPDILAEVAQERRPGQLFIGFAAETQDAIANGRAKLRKKGIDAIVINDVSQSGIGFDSDRNEVTIVTAYEEIKVPEAAKTKIAHRILDAVLKLKTESSKAASIR